MTTSGPNLAAPEPNWPSGTPNLEHLTPDSHRNHSKKGPAYQLKKLLGLGTFGSPNGQRYMPLKQHIAVLGAGAVGLTLAAYLRASGHRVTLVIHRASSVPRALSFDDQIGNRQLAAGPLESCTLDGLDVTPDHLIVCTRGEQLDEALDGLSSMVRPEVPISIAAATLDSIRMLKQRHALPNPMLRFAIGFAAWPVSTASYRVFSLRPKGGSALCAEASPPASAKQLAQLLTEAGLPTQAPPAGVFVPLFHSMLAVETARMLAFRAAGWELSNLSASPELIDLCACAMREAASIARAEGGVYAWLASVQPRWTLRAMARYRANTASQGFREVWRYHGPKTNEQVDFLAQQLFDRAGARSTDALRRLRDMAPTSDLKP